jgi:PRC-barrel domain
MRETGRVVLLSVFLLLLAAVATRAENQSQATAPAATTKEPAAAATKEPVPPPSVTVIAPREAHGVLGRDVRSLTDEDMGRIVDVIVDRTGTVRAAVIDFGGFLGVGSRKIVVDWNALHFGRVNDKSDNITLELSKAQVAAAPEYKEDTPIVVLGAAGNLSPFEYDH